jgi:hypothetical protein
VEQSYTRAPYFRAYSSRVASVFDRHWDRLVDLNVTLIGLLIEALGIKVKVSLASELGLQGRRTALLLAICQAKGADRYLSGVSGRDYINPADFEAVGIQIEFQRFYHPVYRQMHQPFLPCLSSVDLLFNCGPGSLDVLRGRGVPTLPEPVC